MPENGTGHPDIATREAWLAERRRLLAREREVTHLRDAVNAERRRMPMVKVDKDYRFEGPDGELGLIEMFDGRTQLYVHHFMWIDAIDRGCPSCTAAADLTFTERDRGLLSGKGVTFACVSRAPYASISRCSGEYNYKSLDELHADGWTDEDLRGDWPGASIFFRNDDEVFHTYSAYARGLDHTAVGYPFLDMTPFGRQEAWEDSPSGWPQGSVAAGEPHG
jgi:predicted dithiol-disulfide oxidoreductase (DUF899 family)